MTEDEKSPQEISASPPHHNHWWVVATLVLLIATLASLAFLQDERRQRREMAAGYDQMSATLNQTRSQIEAVTAKLNAATAAPPPAPVMSAERPPEAKAHRASRSRQAARKQAPAEDPRWKKIQAELEDHQKQIAATQEEMQKTRAELDGNLRSTRDELGGSIARNHEELVSLQKRGERDYSEFDLVKSKQYHRAGPLGISVRKADRKRQYCDLKLLVDDIEITKKHVNLFEPVMLYPADYKSPVELVINQIDKDGARGYVSAPKYRASELTTGAPTATAEPGYPPSTASLEHRQPASPR